MIKQNKMSRDDGVKKDDEEVRAKGIKTLVSVLGWGASVSS